VIKSKVLRLKLPSEVNASASTARRSKVTGHLVVEMPKIDEKAPALFMKRPEKAAKEERLKRLNGERREGAGAPCQKTKSVGIHSKPLDNRKPSVAGSMADLMMRDAPKRTEAMTAVASRQKTDDPPPPPLAALDDDDEPPPPC
jgi:protein TilB